MKYPQQVAALLLHVYYPGAELKCSAEQVNFEMQQFVGVLRIICITSSWARARVHACERPHIHEYCSIPNEFPQRFGCYIAGCVCRHLQASEQRKLCLDFMEVVKVAGQKGCKHMTRLYLEYEKVSLCTDLIQVHVEIR